jgi:hypothetical protein
MNTLEDEDTKFLLHSSVISSKSCQELGSRRGFELDDEPASLRDKKLWYEKSKLLQPLFKSMHTNFTSADYKLLEELAAVADENFEVNNLNHLRHLKTLYTEAFGPAPFETDIDFISNESVILKFRDIQSEFKDVIKNKNWEHLGFQSDTPGTDFRGGGLLSLIALVVFAKQERQLLKEIIEYKKRQENYLFACSVISSVFFLKNYLHFGVWSNYRHFLRSKVASRKLCRLFLTVLRTIPTAEERVAFFTSVVIIFVKKLFFYWRFQNVKRAMSIMDFKAVEQIFQVQFRSKMESLRKEKCVWDGNTFLMKIENFKF